MEELDYSELMQAYFHLGRKPVVDPSTLCLLMLLLAIGVYWFIIHPHTYKVSHAVKNGDVVMGPGKDYNIEKFDTFINNVSNKTHDEIRITAYSKEGYPIIFDLQFNGKVIHCTVNNTRNLYGRDYKKIKSVHTTIIKNSNNDYFLVDDNGINKDQWIFQRKE